MAGSQEQDEGVKSVIKGDTWFGSLVCVDELGIQNKKTVILASFCVAGLLLIFYCSIIILFT